MEAEKKQFVVFRLGDEEYGLSLIHLHISGGLSICAVTLFPSWISGPGLAFPRRRKMMIPE